MRCASVALTSVALIVYVMTATGTRATTQMTLHKYATIAVEEKWSANTLAEKAGCNRRTAEKYLNTLVTASAEKTQREVLTLADSYRSTLERTAARSREYLESISHLDLDALDKEQRALRREALSSLTSLSSMLRLEVTGDASTPRQLGNL